MCYDVFMAKYPLKKLRAVVSGASSGIGRELVKRLVDDYGCEVYGAGRNEERLEELKNSLKNGKNFRYALFDVSDEKSWRAFAEKLEKEGFAPDMLVNNAGYLLPFGKAEKHSVKEAENILSTNYLSCVYSFHAFLPLLKKSAAPAVVNVSSSAALAPVAGTALYSSSKAALKSFTECLAMDYKGEIYIAGVYPGFTKTAIFSHQKRSADSKLIDAVTMPVDKAVKRILKKLKRKKTYIVTGADAKAMNFFYRLFPRLTANAIRGVLKQSNMDIFKDVF